jgi:hypothetical protein
MSRRLWFAVVCSLAAAVPGSLRADEPRELTVIAGAFDSPRADNIGPVHLKDYGGVAIRGPGELAAHSDRAEAAKDPAVRQALEAELARLLDVKTIDWEKQMVLAVRGEPGTRADRVHFDGFRVEGKVLTVTWTVKQRPPHAGPGTPIALVLVERFDGEVKFVP